MRKINLKQVFIFLLFLGIYMIPYILIPVDKEFYNSLNKINVPPIVFIIVWSIIYILLSIYWTKNYKLIFREKKRLFIYLILNYAFNFLFMIFMFKLHILFWSFVMCVLSFITILFSYMEALLFSKKQAYLFIPDVLWSFVGTILSIIIYVLN